MAENLLEVRNLVVNVEDKEILHNINLDIKPGETHVLMGPNGAGKSTLGYALMGNPKYTVKGGSINFAGEDITKLAVDKIVLRQVCSFPSRIRWRFPVSA